MVYCEDAGEPRPPHFVDPARKGEFAAWNAKLTVLYDHLIDAALGCLPPAASLSAAEVGCATGHFLLGLAHRGVKRAIGYDSEDYSRCFDLLNDITKLGVEFRHRPWNAETRTLDDADPADLVLSIAVLCHVSEPLQHLAMLGKLARKALLVWAPTIPGESRMMLNFVSANRYYRDRVFPYNFDFVSISAPLVQRAMEWMGFRVYIIPNCADGMHDAFFSEHVAMLGIRP